MTGITRVTIYGDWKDWDYKAWMTEIIKTTKDDKGS